MYRLLFGVVRCPFAVVLGRSSVRVLFQSARDMLEAQRELNALLRTEPEQELKRRAPEEEELTKEAPAAAAETDT